MQYPGDTMSRWVFLSKNGEDEYINRFAQGSGGHITDTDAFVYEHSEHPIVLRGILKHKIMHRCWQDQRRFWYMDSGYMGNRPGPENPHGWKVWHRVVANDLQHGDIVPRPDDRLRRLNWTMPRRRYGRQIIVAVPDEKPCRFYGIDRDQWVDQTVSTLNQLTNRPITVRQRHPDRSMRVHQDPLDQVLVNDVHALVTFNSVAAIEAIQAGVPAFVLAPSHAARPVAASGLDTIENPHWPDNDLIYQWACHLAYGQVHVSELRDGTALRILNAD